MTSSAEGIEPKRSEEYSKLLEELRNSFVSAANMAVKLYEQGKKDGLSKEEIRKDIEITLDGIVKEGRLREILPAELTRSYTQAITSNSAIIAGTETNNQTKEEMTAWKEIRHQVLDRIKKTGSSSNKLQRKSKSKSKKEITPQQSIALIASIIIIIIAIGGLGIVYNVFAQNQNLNQNLTTGTAAPTTYENTEHGFAFDYPATWVNEFDSEYEAQLNNFVVALADPSFIDEDGYKSTIFRVNVSDVHKYLDDDLQIKADTAEDYARNKIKAENKVDEDTNYLLRTQTDLGRYGGSLHTLDNIKNTTTSIGGENASKVQYIQSYEGEQMVFNIFIYVVKDDKVYELSFYTEPLNVPETLPIGENIIKSFRFI
jgi:PsbP-like protein